LFVIIVLLSTNYKVLRTNAYFVKRLLLCL